MNYLLRTSKAISVIAFCLVGVAALQAQPQYNISSRINTVTTAVPFLRINPDARAGGMGDVGLATPTDANAIYVNPAKLAFIDKDFGASISFSPWLKALVNDIYLASLNGYYKVKKEQTIALGVRYFSLGNITFTDYNGTETGQFRPNEFAIDLHYARKLGDYFSIAASLRYIYSNLAGGQSVDGNLVKPGNAGAGDISAYFHKTFNQNEAHKLEHEFAAGLAITNIGSKISYTGKGQANADFIPTNLGLGVGYTLGIDKHNSVGVYLDANKLLVPTPNPTDSTRAWKKKSSIGGIFSSFGDAPGGTKEEFNEVTWSVGAEYMYNKQFGVRFGYFYEHPLKGNRQFLTAGLTVKYSVVGLNFSYLIPTSIQRNPLDNTLRFTLLFDFVKGGKKAGENNSGISLVPDTPKKKKTKEEKPAAEPQPEKQNKLEPVEPK